VVLPGGQAYWTVLDGDYEVAELFDGFLRWLRLVNGRCGEHDAAVRVGLRGVG
jgi:hypothetical protein